jgi:hypothetical protein
MPLQSISRLAFDQLNPDRLRLSHWFHEEVEWFVERSKILIGCIAKNMQSDDWFFVVEGRDERGQFHEVESRDHLASREDARALLETTVHRLLATGMKVFPRSAALHSR